MPHIWAVKISPFLFSTTKDLTNPQTFKNVTHLTAKQSGATNNTPGMINKTNYCFNKQCPLETVSSVADVWFVLSINQQLAISACKVTSEVFCQTPTVVPKSSHDRSSIHSESSMCIFWHFPLKNVPIVVELWQKFL